MAWEFRCDNPDFTVRSLPDNVRFGVRRACLETGSDIFRDMFASVDDTAADPSLDVSERAGPLAILLRLLHDPPSDLGNTGTVEPRIGNNNNEGDIVNSAVPLPVLRTAFDLADKYALTEGITRALRSHLRAHVAVASLEVYGLAWALGEEEAAAAASFYLVHPPLDTYTPAQVALLPSVAALHALVRLHALREAKLKEILRLEEVFPHGYGRCSRHGAEVEHKWDTRRASLLPYVQAGTDVAAEMRDIIDAVGSCPDCKKACVAAVDMLAYKCRRTPKGINKLPPQ